MLQKTDYFYNTFRELMDRVVEKNLVVDIGTSQRFAKELGWYRRDLEEKYIALGYNPSTEYGDDTCDINGDILALPFLDASIPALVCFEVLEHVPDPKKAMSEMWRVLETGGMLFLSVPFLLPYHGKSESMTDYSHAGYPDYWRFTTQGLQQLAHTFSQVSVYPTTNSLDYYLSAFPFINKLPFITHRWFKKLMYTVSPIKETNPTNRIFLLAIK